MRILVVDSDPLMQQTYKLLFSAKDYTLTVATSADEVKVFLKSQTPPFDAAIVDYRLGSTTGEKVIRDIREVDPTMAVVVVTGIDDLKTRNACTQAGASAYVVKGSDVTLLPSILTQLRSRP